MFLNDCVIKINPKEKIVSFFVQLITEPVNLYKCKKKKKKMLTKKMVCLFLLDIALSGILRLLQ